MRNLKAPKPKAIIFDLRETAVKTSFIDKVVIQYIKTSVKSYVEQKWTEKELTKDVERLRAQSQKDESKILGTDAEMAEQQ
jgi:methionine salvage enolase-phosphatase E1